MKKWVIALVIGLALISLSFKGKDSTIDCGGKTMQPGYVCEQNGSTRTYSEMAEAQKSSQEAFQSWIRWVLLGVGAVLTIGGFVGVMKVRRTRRTSAEPDTQGTNVPYSQGADPAQHNRMPQPSYPAQPQQMWDPQQAPYPPQPQHPQQTPHPPLPQQLPQPRYPQQTSYSPQAQYPQQPSHPPQSFGPPPR